MGPHQITVRVQYRMKSCGDGWVLVGPTAFKAVVRRAERLGCVRFARISAKETTSARASPEAWALFIRKKLGTPPCTLRSTCF